MTCGQVMLNLLCRRPSACFGHPGRSRLNDLIVERAAWVQRLLLSYAALWRLAGLCRPRPLGPYAFLGCPGPPEPTGQSARSVSFSCLAPPGGLPLRAPPLRRTYPLYVPFSS